MLAQAKVNGRPLCPVSLGVDGHVLSEAANRWRDASGKFLSTQEVARRVDELRSKFPPVQKAIEDTGRAAQTASSQLGFLGHTISTALGTAITGIISKGLNMLTSSLSAPMSVTQAWGGQLHELSDIFGLSDENATAFALAMKNVGMTVEDGTAGFGVFTRQISNIREQISDAASTFSTASSEISSSHADAVNKIARDWREAQQEAASNIASVWSDLSEKRTEIETTLAESVLSIQEGLQERLADLAEQRADLQKDTAKSLVKLEGDTRDRLRNAHSVRERRQVRKEAAERKQEILEQAAEREKQIAKQEAREKKQAEKQIALAEKVADKQIKAAERAADKQVEAITKAMEKQQRAVTEQIAEADKAAAKQFAAASKALSDVKDKAPLSRALRDLGLTFEQVTDESRPFTDRLGDIMDAFARLPEGVDSAGIAIQIFGRGGLQWLDFLRQGRKGLESARELGIELGIVLNPDEIKAYGRALRSLDTRFMALGINIGREVLPYAQELVTLLNKKFLEAIPSIQKAIKRLGDAFKTGGLEGLGKEFWKILTEPKGLFETLGSIVKQIQDWFTKGDGKKILEGAGSAFSAILTGFGTWAESTEAQAAIVGVTQIVGSAIMAGIQLILSAAEKVAEVMAALMASLEAWVVSDKGQRAIASLTEKFASAVISGLETLFSKKSTGETLVGSLATNIWKAAKSLSSTMASIGANIASTIVGGLATFFFGAEAGERIRRALIDPLTSAIRTLITPGGPIVYLGGLLAAALIGAIQAKVSELTKGWNPVQDLIDQITGKTPTTTPKPLPWNGEKMEEGGPVRRTGLALMHAGEYVLNRQQTLAWAPILAAQGGGPTYNFYHNWPGSVPPSQREWTESMVKRVTQSEVDRILRRG